MAVVQHLLRGIDAGYRFERAFRPILAREAHRHLAAVRKVVRDALRYAFDGEGLPAGQPQALHRLPWNELQRQNAHAD